MHTQHRIYQFITQNHVSPTISYEIEDWGEDFLKKAQKQPRFLGDSHHSFKSSQHITYYKPSINRSWRGKDEDESKHVMPLFL